MSDALVIPCVMALLGLFVLVLPHISPRHFFEAPVEAEFQEIQPAREGRLYRIHTFGFILVIMGITGALIRVHPATLVILPLLPEFVGGTEHYRTYFRIRKNALPPRSGVREAELSATQDQLPKWSTLAVVPFLFPLAAFAYLRFHWDTIPPRYPVNWRLTPEPTHQATRTVLHVASPLLFAEGLLVLLLFLILVEFHGARRSRSLSVTIAALIAVMYFISAIFSGIALAPLVRIPVWVTLPFTVIFIAGLLAWVYKMNTEPHQSSETTPDECWIAGAVYANPEDPALFVEKRTGLGFTLNFGNLGAVGVMAVFVGGIVGLIALLFWLQR